MSDTAESTIERPPGPQLFDFQRPVGMADNTRRRLELAFDEAAGAVESWLGAQLREPIDVSVDLLEEARFGLFRRELTRPCNAFLLAVEGASDPGVLTLDPELAFTIFERVLGSQADQILVPERPLTWIERAVLREVVEQIGQIIGRAWQEQLPISLSVSGFEAVPEMLPHANQEATLQARLRIGGEGWVSTLTLVLPASAVARAVTRHREVRPDIDPLEQAENRSRIQTTLRRARLPVSVRLPRFAVSLRQISDLAPGTVVSSALAADTDVEIYVGDKLRFTGRIGRKGNHLAVEVLKSIPPGAEPGSTGDPQ